MLSAERLMAENKGSDLYVLPETWTTGFMTNPHECVDERSTEEALTWMSDTARDNGCAVCGSVAIKTVDGNFKNRQYFVLPDGTHAYYDKRHLFTYGRENVYYTAGNKRVISEYMGVRFLLLTCYDLRFPVWARYKDDYDAIIVTANWPDSRRDVWQILLKARAIENQCYVIGVNRVGSDPQCFYAGDSAIIDAKGRVIAQATGHGEQGVTAEIDIETLRSFREKFPVLRDRDIL